MDIGGWKQGTRTWVLLLAMHNLLRSQCTLLNIGIDGLFWTISVICESECNQAVRCTIRAQLMLVTRLHTRSLDAPWHHLCSFSTKDELFLFSFGCLSGQSESERNSAKCKQVQLDVLGLSWWCAGDTSANKEWMPPGTTCAPSPPSLLCWLKCQLMQ